MQTVEGSCKRGVLFSFLFFLRRFIPSGVAGCVLADRNPRAARPFTPKFMIDFARSIFRFAYDAATRHPPPAVIALPNPPIPELLWTRRRAAPPKARAQ